MAESAARQPSWGAEQAKTIRILAECAAARGARQDRSANALLPYVARGEAFLLQGLDCVETCADRADVATVGTHERKEKEYQ